MRTADELIEEMNNHDPDSATYNLAKKDWYKILLNRQIQKQPHKENELKFNLQRKLLKLGLH